MRAVIQPCRTQALDRQLASIQEGRTTAEHPVEAILAEIEDLLSYCNDIVANGEHPPCACREHPPRCLRLSGGAVALSSAATATMAVLTARHRLSTAPMAGACMVHAVCGRMRWHLAGAGVTQVAKILLEALWAKFVGPVLLWPLLTKHKAVPAWAAGSRGGVGSARRALAALPAGSFTGVQSPASPAHRSAAAATLLPSGTDARVCRGCYCCRGSGVTAVVAGAQL